MKTPPTVLLIIAGLSFAPGLRAQAPPAPTAPPVAPLTLRYKFTPGEVLRYRMTMDMTYGTPAIGAMAARTTQSHSEIVSRQTVRSIRPADGAATLVARIESMTTTTGGQTHAATAAELAKINSGNVTVMTPTGQVERAKVDSLSTSGGLPGLDPSKGFLTSTGALPTGPVAVGDTWDGSGASGMLGMQMKLLSTLNGVDTSPAATLADIGQTYTGTFAVSPNGLQMTGQLSGSGQMHFDATAGAVADSVAAMNMDMAVALPAAAMNGAPAGTPNTLNVKLTLSMKMKRLSSTP